MSPSLSIGEQVVVEIAARRPLLQVRIAGRTYDVRDLQPGGTSAFSMVLNGQTFTGWRHVASDAIYVHLNGRTHVVRRQRADVLDGAAGVHAAQIVAEFPGTVVAVHCREGDEVRPGERLLTTESMKLQVTHVSPRKARVQRIGFAVDASFGKGAVLVSFAAEAAP